MASEADVVKFVVGQLGRGASAKAMFGEYGLYLDGQIIGLFCDNRLFLKPTPQAAALLGEHELAPAYPGAKPSILVPEELWDEGSLMKKLAQATALGLAQAQPAKRSAKKASAKKAPAAKAPTKKAPAKKRG